MSNQPSVLTRLMEVIEARKRTPSANSYTRTLFDGGVDLLGTKLCEEAGEVAEAARLEGNEGREAVVHEAADLVYHLLVMLSRCGVTLADVEAEIARRFGTSGLEEKARRVSNAADRPPKP
jgi:phosphoribosyl-ATP pyrophosphohydrolase